MGWVTAYLFGHFFIYLHFFVLSKNCLKGEWTKNGGIWGEEIFCPRANRFFLPAARGRRALDFSEISDKISSSRVVNILHDKTFWFFGNHFAGGAKRRPVHFEREILFARRALARLAV